MHNDFVGSLEKKSMITSFDNVVLSSMEDGKVATDFEDFKVFFSIAASYSSSLVLLIGDGGKRERQ